MPNSLPSRRHPNKLPFSGVLTLVDTPSDKGPSGSNGHRVMITREAAEAALWSLEGMAVDYKPGWEGHNSKIKIGVIETAWIDGKEVHVAGYLYHRDFKNEVGEIVNHNPERPLGMSYEIADAHVEDWSQTIWSLSKFTFTGAAILYCDKAAYKATRFNISASEEDFDGKLSFIDSCDTTGSLQLDVKDSE